MDINIKQLCLWYVMSFLTKIKKKKLVLRHTFVAILLYGVLNTVQIFVYRLSLSICIKNVTGYHKFSGKKYTFLTTTTAAASDKSSFFLVKKCVFVIKIYMVILHSKG